MARPKKTNIELTPEEQDLQFVSTHTTNSDKISWNRKYNNLQSLLSELYPIEEQIAELVGKKQPLYDEIAELRKLMLEECIHPLDQLVHKGDHIHCKFCMKNIVINKTTTV